MGMKYAEEPFNMGMFFLPKASFIMGPFPDPQHTHPGIFFTGVAPPVPWYESPLRVQIHSALWAFIAAQIINMSN